ITAALAAAQAIADLSKRNDELAALNRLATSAGTMTDSTELFARGSTALAAVIRCAGIAFFLLRPEEDVAVLVHQYGGTDATRAFFARVPLASSRIGQVAR
ncbi:hypothetical protein G6O45_28750, partial [Salmonella enterica subsp. enterica serovar Istanbul]|nr:hypothetical protein [Salmonella enterica subsp. enterica serovar Istanbul]